MVDVVIGITQVMTGVDKPGQKPNFHAPPGGSEAVARRPISTAENGFLDHVDVMGAIIWVVFK